MAEGRHVPITDTGPTPGATAILRTVNGESQIVVVCERCAEIHQVTVHDAMRTALNAWMTTHEAHHR